MSTAILCPGQGAQSVGMGVSWAQESPAAADVFERCGKALELDLLGICRDGPAEELTRTDVAQPAILATSAACLAALDIDFDTVGATLGLSLGEYTALYAASVLEWPDEPERHHP